MDINTKKKTIGGMLWTSLQKFGVMGISFISNMVLARLLTPDDYGCIGMLTIFILISKTFIDTGFADALIQKKTPTEIDYSTVFYWNLLISVLFYCIVYVSAPFISDFYSLDLLTIVLRVEAIVLIINSLGIIQRTKLRKELRFKKIAVINLISSVISVIIAIYMAYSDYGVWSLVFQQIIYDSVNLILFWSFNRWTPLLVFSKKSFKELFGFGTFLLFSNLINTFFNNIQTLLIGKFFNPTLLGYFTQSKKLEITSSTSISEIVSQVSYPIFSKYQDDNKNLCKIIKKFVTALSYFSFPLMLMLAIISKPLIILLYSEKWIECVPIFQLLCLGGIAISLQSVNYDAVAAVGKSKKIFVWTIFQRFTGIFVIIMGYLFYDFWGFIVGGIFSSYINYLVNAYLVSKFVGYNIFHQLLDILPVILLSFSVFFIVILIPLHLNVFLLAITRLIIYITMYISFSYIFKIQASQAFFNILKSNISKRIF